MRRGWPEVEVHPSLKDTYSIPKLEVEFFMGFRGGNNPDVNKRPYTNALVGMLLECAGDPNRIIVTEFPEGSALAGEVGIMANMSSYTRTDGEDVYMQLLWHKAQTLTPGRPVNSLKDYEYFRRSDFSISTGSVNNALAGDSYHYLYRENQLLRISATDAKDAQGKIHGQFEREPVSVANLRLKSIKDFANLEGAVTRPWLLRFIMEFEKTRTRLDKSYPAVDRAREMPGQTGNFTVDLAQGQIFI